ncbi:hypothetical protein [Deinococcus yavapaiensis]|uniref:Uncharacterized protein n=1 Tax=Deinococcus yavapaiensis KR-236 TaxID=694435 RepID=A0A318SBS9_9DEIO|nr:hypothetical protein [Deinococcus yavapaiensis]PYE53810.1 hypothetical protein DES52_10768 [Deinococcus yavapaiensis KR-236]
MPKDDMAIEAHIPPKAIHAALAALRLQDEVADVQWDVAKSKPSRPTKVYFQAERIEALREAKNRLERLLNEAGYDLYP